MKIFFCYQKISFCFQKMLFVNNDSIFFCSSFHVEFVLFLCNFLIIFFCDLKQRRLFIKSSSIFVVEFFRSVSMYGFSFSYIMYFSIDT